MVVIGLWGGAPWYWWLPVGGAFIAIGCVLIANQKSGATLTRSSLHFHHGKTSRTVPLAEIAKVECHSWTEGPDDIALVLRSGAKVDIPSQCRDRGFVEALARAGVEVSSA
jgi:hypothetical protein